MISQVIVTTASAQQSPKHGCRAEPHPPAERYTAGTVRNLGPAEIDSLRSLLRQPERDWCLVRRYYFGQLYTPQFADVIIYIDTGGAVRQALIKDDRLVKNRVLHGEKFVYVLLFSEDTRRVARGWSPASSDSGIACRLRPANSVQVVRTSLDFQTDPFISRLLKGVGTKLFGTVPDLPSGGLADTTIRLPFCSLGPGLAETTHLYVAFGRFRLVENTWNRITVTADTGRELPRDQSIVTNFANANATPFAVSLGVGVTFRAQTQGLQNDTLITTGQPRRVNLYLLGHVYFPFARPELPRRRRSAGLVFGTNLLNGDLLNDLIAGVSVDRVMGDMGFIGGINLLPSKDRNGRDVRITRPFFGVDFQL